MSVQFFPVLITACVITLCTHAQAQWPSDPATPLSLGETLGFGPDHQVVTTPDGATWIAWIDHQCFASLRVQRISSDGTVLTPGGMVLETRDNCDSLSPRIVAHDDNTVAVSAVNLPSTTQPVYRLAPDGEPLWGPGMIADPALANSIEKLLALPNGDTLLAGKVAFSIILGRYTAAGASAWEPATVTIPGFTGSNMRIFGLQPDGNDGAYLVWDAPGTYTRTVLATRIDALGTPVWSEPLVLVAIPPGSSRHTDPVALADGTGGLLLLWTQGAESASTVVPLRMQRIDEDGNFLLPVAGQRVSMSSTRQFDIRVVRQPVSNDLFLAWRDGPFNDQSVRAQRMSLAGDRLWGDSGLLIAPVAGSASKFSIASLDDNTLGITVGDAPIDPDAARVMLYRVSTSGQQTNATVAVSGAVDAGPIQSAALGDAMTVVWQQTGAGNMNELVAQRVRPDGTLGLADSDADGIDDAQDNCLHAANADQRDSNGDGFGNRCDADLNDDCIVNIVDLGLMRSSFFSSQPDADLDGDGTVNVIDLGLLRFSFFAAPGPSGTVNSCP